MCGFERQVFGVTAFVGVLLAFRWSSNLLPSPDPFATAPEPLTWAAYHWAVIPMVMLAIVGAALAVARPDPAGGWVNWRAAGSLMFAASIIAVRLNPGLAETTFNPHSARLPWQTSYHWGLPVLIVAAVVGAGIALFSRPSMPSSNRQALGLLVFAGAFLVLFSIPGLIHQEWRVVDGTDAEHVSYHWGVILIALLAVGGAAMAVLPQRGRKAVVELRGSSAMAGVGTLILALYPLLVANWFYLYVVRQRLLLGFWPRPYRPDPKQAGLDFHHESIAMAYDAVPIIALAGMACIVAMRANDPSYRWRWVQAAWVASLGIFIVLVKFDPGNFIEWWAD